VWLGKYKSKSQWSITLQLLRRLQQRKKNNKYWGRCRKIATFVHWWKMILPLCKVWWLPRKLKHGIMVWSKKSTLRCVLKITERLKKAFIWQITIHKAKRWKQDNCPSTNEWINKMWDTHYICNGYLKKNGILIQATT
jgi:hypothetical protein